MIFQRSLLREFAHTSLAAFSVLLLITLAAGLIRLLGRAATGNIPAGEILAFLGFTSLRYVAILLSLSLFIAVLMTLTRKYRDSEMIIWFASGVSLMAWVRPVLTFAAPIVLLIGLMSLFLTPWAIDKSEEFKRQIESREELALAAPGVFRESKNAERVYFFEQRSGELTEVSNIFVHTHQHGRIGTMVAMRGYEEVAENGDRFLVLLDGRRYEGEPGSLEYRIVEFERYAVRIDPRQAKAASPPNKARPLVELLLGATPPELGELSWRVGQPLSALILSLLAIPLSFVNPRSGRSWNLILALLIYATYSNFLSLAQAWIAHGRIGVTAGLVGVHVFMLAVLALLFYHRLSVYSLFRLRR
jgi:lipopolysaccharide export system permease protein